MQEATRLKCENDALRKLSEDAVLDQQLKKALQETDKLKAAADAYKKDLLQQKLSDKEWELQQAGEQMADVEKENSGQAPSVPPCLNMRADIARGVVRAACRPQRKPCVQTCSRHAGADGRRGGGELRSGPMCASCSQVPGVVGGTWHPQCTTHV